MPSRRERILIHVMLYLIAIGVTTLYYGGIGGFAAAGFLALGFHSGRYFTQADGH